MKMRRVDVVSPTITRTALGRQAPQRTPHTAPLRPRTTPVTHLHPAYNQLPPLYSSLNNNV